MPADCPAFATEQALTRLLGDPFLQSLAAARGVDCALDFAQARGGHRLYVAANGAGAVERFFGADAARELARAWGGLHVEVPHATRARIARMAGRGESVSTMAHACGRSRRYVRAQLARLRAAQKGQR